MCQVSAETVMTAPAKCDWCGNPFEPRKFGRHEKRFCSTRCKDQFHTAARRYVDQAISAGAISVDDLKAAQSSCTTH